MSIFNSLLLVLIGCCSLGFAEETRFIEAEGAQLFCRVIGEGDPIVVIHGGPGLTQDYLLPYMDRLGETHRVIFYDQRACGLSTGTLDEASICMETFVEDLESIRRAFGYTKMTVLGHSWGGFVAMHYDVSYWTNPLLPSIQKIAGSWHSC